LMVIDRLMTGTSGTRPRRSIPSRSTVRRMRLPFERVGPETVISGGAAPAADLDQAPDAQRKAAEQAELEQQDRPGGRVADRTGERPENEAAEQDEDRRAEVEQQQPPAGTIAVMQPLYAHCNAGDEQRQIDDGAHDFERRIVAPAPSRPARGRCRPRRTRASPARIWPD